MKFFSKEKPTAFHIILASAIVGILTRFNHQFLGMCIFFLSFTPYIFRKSAHTQTSPKDLSLKVRENSFEDLRKKIVSQKQTTSGLTIAIIVVGLLFCLPIIAYMLEKVSYPTDSTTGQGAVWLAIFMWPILVPLGIALATSLGINQKVLNDAEYKMKQTHGLTNLDPKKKSQMLIAQTITPLLGAIITGDIALVQTALQDQPEELNTAYAQNGNTPLHAAALNGYTEIVRLLLEQLDIDTTRTNNDGKTALDLAREKKFKEIVKLLENKQL